MKRVLVTFLFVCSLTVSSAIDFDYELTGSNQSILITSSVQITGLIGEGSTIGAFFTNNNGDLICAGSGIWYSDQSLGMALWGSIGIEDNGFSEGEQITWYVQSLDGTLTELEIVYGDGGANLYQTNTFRWISELILIQNEGCMDDNFVEYNPFATSNDGSCLTTIIYGCLDQNSPFYDPSANTPDSSCSPSSIYGCTQAQFYEYNEWATIDDGSCDVYWQALYYDGVWEIEDLEEEVVDLQNEINISNNSYESLLAQLEAVQNLLEETENSLTIANVSNDNFQIEVNELLDENVELSILISDQQIQIDDLVEGYEIGIDEPIAVDINYGWNMIGFTRKTPMDSGASFEGILDKVILIKDNSANLFWPEFGFNGLGDLIPGHGYQIKVNDDIDNFIFPYVVGERLEMSPQVPTWAFEMAPTHPNEVKILVRKINLLGQEVIESQVMTGEVILYLYSDGSVEKFIR